MFGAKRKKIEELELKIKSLSFELDSERMYKRRFENERNNLTIELNKMRVQHSKAEKKWKR